MAKRKSWEKYLLFIVRQMPAEVRSEYIEHGDEIIAILVKNNVIVFSDPFAQQEDLEEGVAAAQGEEEAEEDREAVGEEANGTKEPKWTQSTPKS